MADDEPEILEIIHPSKNGNRSLLSLLEKNEKMYKKASHWKQSIILLNHARLTIFSRLFS